jgi:hypothetical protein
MPKFYGDSAKNSGDVKIIIGHFFADPGINYGKCQKIGQKTKL